MAVGAVKDGRVVGPHFELVKVEPDILVGSGQNKVVGACQVGRVAGRMSGRVKVTAFLAGAHVSEITSAQRRRSPGDRIFFCKQMIGKISKSSIFIVVYF